MYYLCTLRSTIDFKSDCCLEESVEIFDSLRLPLRKRLNNRESGSIASFTCQETYNFFFIVEHKVFGALYLWSYLCTGLTCMTVLTIFGVSALLITSSASIFWSSSSLSFFAFFVSIFLNNLVI